MSELRRIGLTRLKIILATCAVFYFSPHMAKTLKVSDDIHARAKVRASQERIKLETFVEQGIRLRLANKPSRTAHLTRSTEK